MAGSGEDVADFDVTIRDNDTVNQEVDERPSLLEIGRVETFADLSTKGFQRLGDRAQGDVLLLDNCTK